MFSNGEMDVAVIVFGLPWLMLLHKSVQHPDRQFKVYPLGSTLTLYHTPTKVLTVIGRRLCRSRHVYPTEQALILQDNSLNSWLGYPLHAPKHNFLLLLVVPGARAA